MLPISVMAIAGLFLGIGSAVVAHTALGGSLNKLGLFIQNLGGPVFTAMPILFCAAIAVAFTEEAGVAVFASIIGMLIFASIQSIFIEHVKGGYKILFSQWGREPANLKYIVGSIMGITALNSSIFGGIVVGSTVAYLYNRFHTIQLPLVISFFGGKRFVSLITIIAMIPIAFLFLLFWPWIGIGLTKFGQSIGKIPYGVSSLIFGFCERSLIPFGLHHVFYAPLWWTGAGGNAEAAFQAWLAQGNHIAMGSTWTDAWFNKLFSGGLAGWNASNWRGDSFIWIAASKLPFDSISWTSSGGITHTLPVFKFFAQQLHINLSQFLDGKFPFMIFGLPAAGLAMVMAAPKANRRMALGTVFPAALTSFVTGVTEPIEFTFLFLAPLLFWGFHAAMAAISFWLMNILGAHVGMTFSGGFLDLIIYGMIPFAKGTMFWWVFVIGPVYAIIYYFVFYIWILKADLATPGRGGNTKLFTKADYKSKTKTRGKLLPQGKAIIIAMGGWDNITNYSNCATRLRYDIKDYSKIKITDLKKAGAYGTVKVGQKHIQIILGPPAAQVNANIRDHIGEKINK